MSLTFFRNKKGAIHASPWIIVGSVVILLITLVVLAVQNYNREKRYMSRILSEKGAALIKAVEAGARTGMMAMMVTSLPVGLIATDRDGKIAFYNSAAERITGLDLSNTKGTGLGLAIVHNIVKAHNGHIRVRSFVGQGATFIIGLPAKTAGNEGRMEDL